MPLEYCSEDDGWKQKIEHNVMRRDGRRRKPVFFAPDKMPMELGMKSVRTKKMRMQNLK